MEVDKEGILRRLKHSLQLLAASSETQLGLLPSFVCKADELALEFDNWWEIVRRNYRIELSDDQISAAAQLNDKLDWLTTSRKQLWTDDAVRTSPEWQIIRDLAASALRAFGWPVETPPSYAQEYISEDELRKKKESGDVN